MHHLIDFPLPLSGMDPSRDACTSHAMDGAEKEQLGRKNLLKHITGKAGNGGGKGISFVRVIHK